MRSTQTKMHAARRARAWWIAAWWCVLSPTAAMAYSTPDAFKESPSLGGGGGRWFTGSPADGYGCTVCHATANANNPFPVYVAGLPLDGYELAEAREIVLSWPEFAERWTQLRPTSGQPIDPSAPLPSIGLIAELVAESGKASGSVEIRKATAGPAELCEAQRPNEQPRLAARVYQVRPGVAPLVVRPDRVGTLRCEARQLGQRCIVALTPCGARELRIVWTPPPSQEGRIWFSAGFVASEAIDGSPDGDFVTEVAIPVPQAGTEGGRYQQTLQGTCSVSRVGVGARVRGGLWMLGALGLWMVLRGRRRVRAVGHALVGAALSIACVACGMDPADVEPSDYPNAGLYTPGSRLGASDPTDIPEPNAGLGNRCVSPQIARDGGTATSTRGRLLLAYTTQTINGRYAPRNCSAVWIETPDGQFVSTLEIAAALRRPGLVYFQEQTCVDKPGPDVVTSATRTDHSRPHSVTWSGTDLNDNPVPDGRYLLFIEVTETDKEPGEVQMFDFDKGSTPFDRALPVASGGLIAQANLAWEPAP